MSFKTMLVGAAIAAALAGVSTDAHAVTVLLTRTMGQNATGLCNAMAPAQEATLRKFPLGLKNVGTTAQPIACSTPGDQGSPGNNLVRIYIFSEIQTAVDVNCTLVDGDLVQGATFYPKTVNLAAGASSFIGWTPAEFGLAHFHARDNLNCSLPAGVNMSLVAWTYDESVSR